MIFWWVVKKLLGIEHPSYYLGCLSNPEIDEEIKRLKKEGAWS